jgi:hypothetical protein
MSTQADSVPVVKFLTHIAICPHCNKELRVASKYVGQEVNCRFCNGLLRVVADFPAQAVASAFRVVAVPLDSSVTTEGSIPHWPAAVQKQLDKHAQSGYRFLRAFPVGEHLGIVFEKATEPA